MIEDWTPQPMIRFMIRRDIYAAIKIDHLSFWWPLNEEGFCQHLRRSHTIGLVTEYDTQVVGFMIYRLAAQRLIIERLAVASDHRNRGIGRRMVEWLIGKLSSERRNRIVIAVRETNLDGQLFFKRLRGRCLLDALSSSQRVQETDR